MTESHEKPIARTSGYDLTLLFAALILVCLGVTMVFSASGVNAGQRHGDALFYLQRQGVWVGLGLALMLLAARLPHEKILRAAPALFFLGLVMLLLVRIPGIGTTRGGAMRWIALGPITLQPSELAKFIMIVYLANYYGRRREGGGFKATFLIPGMICSALMLLVLLQPDFGTFVVLVCLFLIMAFAAGAPLRYPLAALIPLVPLIAWVMTSADYRVRRLTSFMNPWEDSSNTGYQIIQSFLAFASGGFFGEGLGDGKQKLFFLPEAHSDFVLALIGEELGLVGLVTVLFAFVLLIWRGTAIAIEHEALPGRLLALGLTTMIGMQAAINACVVTGLLPTKGLTLPLVSYGGSSILITLTSIGFLMNIARSPSIASQAETA